MILRISLAVSAFALSLAMPAFADLRQVGFEKAAPPARQANRIWFRVLGLRCLGNEIL